ncbi:MAG: HAMP domain-containing protein [Selenomonadaceae bacterium]|nr:HAMP domain-containing protein [Selenomonadaceae bacterium]
MSLKTNRLALPWYKIKKWRLRLKQPRISTKITALYAALLFVTLLIMSLLMTMGVYLTFYHQAEVEIEISKHHVMDRLAREEPLNFELDFGRDDPLLPGVVLRVTDVVGQLIYENDSHYPSIERVRRGIRANPPFWANSRFFVSDLRNMSLYYTVETVTQGGRIYQLHFFRTITAEKAFLASLVKFLLIINVVAFLLALLTGFLVSNKILSPIRQMTKAARRIEVERLDRRIELPPVKDELYELADTLNHMLDRLQQGFASQQRFVSDASHELRTPVTVLLGYADLLTRWGKDDPEVLAESIASIRSEAENMQELIERLLFLARADQKRQTLHMEELDTAPLLADVMKKMELTAPNHSLTLTANDNGSVMADGGALRQLLRIFLDNAVKYTPDGGKITLSGERQSDFMAVTIKDNGIGIAKEEQEKIFERFYRVDSSRTKGENSTGGSGLGLSIAKWIAAKHGIEIKVTSEPGKGTAFTLLIPLVKK